jgi:hypothetical protein
MHFTSELANILIVDVKGDLGRQAARADSATLAEGQTAQQGI